MTCKDDRVRSLCLACEMSQGLDLSLIGCRRYEGHSLKSGSPNVEGTMASSVLSSAKSKTLVLSDPIRRTAIDFATLCEVSSRLAYCGLV
ncbi:hypothetical protein LZ30DRAFT_731354, partial [Colletotrichum cereale]